MLQPILKDPWTNQIENRKYAYLQPQFKINALQNYNNVTYTKYTEKFKQIKLKKIPTHNTQYKESTKNKNVSYLLQNIEKIR